jgi:hypothetical protein
VAFPDKAKSFRRDHRRLVVGEGGRDPAAPLRDALFHGQRLSMARRRAINSLSLVNNPHFTVPGKQQKTGPAFGVPFA